MDSIKEIMEKVLEFRDERDWKQFHNAKDLSLAISIESSELNELFLWKGAEQADSNRIKEELADVLMFAFLLATQQGIDIGEAILSKLQLNASKYPVAKSKGKATKYNQL